ncbi:hypothetical protein AOLI_G00140190 [Acnodon oligacanthus]
MPATPWQCQSCRLAQGWQNPSKFHSICLLQQKEKRRFHPFEGNMPKPSDYRVYTVYSAKACDVQRPGRKALTAVVDGPYRRLSAKFRSAQPKTHQENQPGSSSSAVSALQLSLRGRINKSESLDSERDKESIELTREDERHTERQRDVHQRRPAAFDLIHPASYCTAAVPLPDTVQAASHEEKRYSEYHGIMAFSKEYCGLEQVEVKITPGSTAQSEDLTKSSMIHSFCWQTVQ